MIKGIAYFGICLSMMAVVVAGFMGYVRVFEYCKRVWQRVLGCLFVTCLICLGGWICVWVVGNTDNMNKWFSNKIEQAGKPQPVLAEKQ